MQAEGNTKGYSGDQWNGTQKRKIYEINETDEKINKMTNVYPD